MSAISDRNTACGICGRPAHAGTPCETTGSLVDSSVAPRSVDAFPAPRRMGWECPRCHRVHAPLITHCAHCARGADQ